MGDGAQRIEVQNNIPDKWTLIQRASWIVGIVTATLVIVTNWILPNFVVFTLCIQFLMLGATFVFCLKRRNVLYRLPEQFIGMTMGFCCAVEAGLFFWRMSEEFSIRSLFIGIGWSAAFVGWFVYWAVAKIHQQRRIDDQIDSIERLFEEIVRHLQEDLEFSRESRKGTHENVSSIVSVLGSSTNNFNALAGLVDRLQGLMSEQGNRLSQRIELLEAELKELRADIPRKRKKKDKVQAS